MRQEIHSIHFHLLFTLVYLCLRSIQKLKASDGQWYALQEPKTEGQGTTAFPSRKPYSLTQLSIPFGGGIKIGVSKDFNVIIEYGLRKTFTDYLDDINDICWYSFGI